MSAEAKMPRIIFRGYARLPMLGAQSSKCHTIIHVQPKALLSWRCKSYEPFTTLAIWRDIEGSCIFPCSFGNHVNSLCLVWDDQICFCISSAVWWINAERTVFLNQFSCIYGLEIDKSPPSERYIVHCLDRYIVYSARFKAMCWQRTILCYWKLEFSIHLVQKLRSDNYLGYRKMQGTH